MIMKKVPKGAYGYLDYKKKISLLIMIASYAVIAVMLIIGYVATKTTANIMTVVAVVMALPAGKFTVSYVILLPHHSASGAQFDATHDAFGGVLTYYDCVFSNSTSPIGTQVVVVSDSLAIALTDEVNADKRLFEKSVSEFCEKDGHPLKVALYTDEASFVSKAKVMCASNKRGDAPSVRIERNAQSLLNMCL